MSEQAPLDLRGLADVDSPEVVRTALKTFRRRLWTRYVWIGLAIVFAAVAFIWGGQPSDLREEIEASHLRSFPEQVWRVGGASVALEEAADLGDYMGLHFVALPDPGGRSVRLCVVGAEPQSLTTGPGGSGAMTWGAYDYYVRLPKSLSSVIEVAVGGPCPSSQPNPNVITVDLRKLMIPPSIWRAEG